MSAGINFEMGLILRDLLSHWHTSFIDSNTYSISSTNILYGDYCMFQIELSFSTGCNVLFLHPSTICFNELPMDFLKHLQLLVILLQSVIEFKLYYNYRLRFHKSIYYSIRLCNANHLN